MIELERNNPLGRGEVRVTYRAVLDEKGFVLVYREKLTRNAESGQGFIDFRVYGSPAIPRPVRSAYEAHESVPVNPIRVEQIAIDRLRGLVKR